MAKRPKHVYPLDVKLSMIKEADSGLLKCKELAAKYSIPQGTVYYILKNRDAILKAGASGSKVIQSREKEYSNLDEIMVRWIRSAGDRNTPCSEDSIEIKAKAVAKKLGICGFRANRWTSAFIARNSNLYRSIMCGKNDAVPEKQNAPKLSAEYISDSHSSAEESEDDVTKTDETANKHTKNLRQYNLLMEQKSNIDSVPEISKLVSSATVAGSESPQLPNSGEQDKQHKALQHYKSSIITSPRSANGYGVKISKVPDTISQEKYITISDVCSISDQLQSSDEIPFDKLELVRLNKVVHQNEISVSDEDELTPLSSLETDSSISPENFSHLGDVSTTSMHNSSNVDIPIIQNETISPQKTPHLMQCTESEHDAEENLISGLEELLQRGQKANQTFETAKQTYETICSEVAKGIDDHIAKLERLNRISDDDDYLLPFLQKRVFDHRDPSVFLKLFLMVLKAKTGRNNIQSVPPKKKKKMYKKFRTTE